MTPIGVKEGQTSTPAEETVKKAEENKATDKINPTSNEQEVHVQPRTGSPEREGGHQPGPNEPLGASQQHEDERANAGGVAGRGGDHSVPDTAGGPRVSGSSDGKRNLKPVKPEPAPLAENECKNTRNNHSLSSCQKNEIYTLPAFELRTDTDSDEVNRGETKGATATSRNSSIDSVHKDSGNATIDQENASKNK